MAIVLKRWLSTIGRNMMFVSISDGTVTWLSYMKLAYWTISMVQMAFVLKRSMNIIVNLHIAGILLLCICLHTAWAGRLGKQENVEKKVFLLRCIICFTWYTTHYKLTIFYIYVFTNVGLSIMDVALSKEVLIYTIKSPIKGTPNSKIQKFLVSSCNCLCPIHQCRMLSREWRCSWQALLQAGSYINSIN